MPVYKVVGDFSQKFLEKKEIKHLGEIEQNLWRNNITFEKRKKKDFLSTEDNEAINLNQVD